MLRQNDLAMRSDMILRVPLLGVRLEPDAFLDQIVEAHRLLSLRVAG